MTAPAQGPIVAIGASAGGLAAIEQLVDGLSEQLQVTFVFCQHLSPEFRSHMTELLGRRTNLKVAVAGRSTDLRPGHFYLTPPRSLTRFVGRRLEVEQPKGGRAPLNPIDHLFTSLATQSDCRRYAIVLSGTGTDGIEGVQRLRESGGIVLAQAPETAGFDGMPRAAIASGAVHLVLRPELLCQAVSHPRFGIPGIEDELQFVSTWNTIDGLLRYLSHAIGVDFYDYRQSTVLRRIERRFDLEPFESLESYRSAVEDDASLRERLVDDLLIAVSDFFRDAYAWMALEQSVIPQLLDRPADQDVRVWSSACSTGQEAYSLAMLFLEAGEGLPVAPRVQIFATDVSESNLLQAKRGRYTSKEVEHLSPERLRRFFRPSGDGYEVTTDLRSLITFSHHNLLKDPPFSNLDLVSCRNLLIYMNPDPREQILARLEFGLREGGHLFLGASEDPGSLKGELRSIGSKTNIFKKLGRNASGLRLEAGELKGTHARPLRRQAPSLAGSEIYGKLLELFLPSALLVAPDGEIIHSFGQVGDLIPMRGAAPFNLLRLISDKAALALTAAFARAQTSSPAPVEIMLTLDREGEERLCFAAVYGIRAGSASATNFLVALKAREPQGSADDEEEGEREDVTQLRRDLRTARSSLDSLSQELGVRNEELQAANEELTSSNEELQSSNEEIQSVNEELRTVNEELQRRIAEKQKLASDLENLLRSTEVGVIFLDMDLRIREFTPAATSLFRMRRHDVGRDILDVRADIDAEDLTSMARRVLNGAEMVEQSLDVGKGNYLVRLHPYRNEEERVEGIVVNVIDVTDYWHMGHADGPGPGDAWRATPALLVASDGSDRVEDVSEHWLRSLGHARAETCGRPHREFLESGSQAAYERALHDLEQRGECQDVELVYSRKDGTRLVVRLDAKSRGQGIQAGWTGVLTPKA